LLPAPDLAPLASWRLEDNWVIETRVPVASADHPSQGSVEWALPASGEGRVLLATLLLVASFGVVDVWSGREIVLSPLYLVAVIIGTWRGGLWVGLGLVISSALTGLVADLLLSEPYLHLENSYTSAWIPFWNAVARGLVLLAAVLSVSKLQALLRDRDQAVRELKHAFGQIRTLESLLPVCAWCRRIRDESDANSWKSMERYIAEHTDTKFNHGMCPECFERVWEEEGLKDPP
jgi:hypothetical protein